MLKYRRGASALIGVGALALTSVVGLGGPAQAATGAEILVPIKFNVPGAHVLPETFKAGDCRQVGQNEAGSQLPSYLTVEKSATIENLYTITWNATLYTVSTNFGDLWHQKFVFRNADGPIAAITFDGPVMTTSGRRYYYQESKNLPLSADQANNITFVDWVGDC
jgi:hypothetical protein